MASSHTDEFLARLKGVSETSNGWEARCPCREDDNNPSLSISEDTNTGNILVSCHRGSPCSSKEICESIGLTQASLFSPQNALKKNFRLQRLTTTPIKTENFCSRNFVTLTLMGGKLSDNASLMVKVDGNTLSVTHLKLFIIFQQLSTQ